MLIFNYYVYLITINVIKGGKYIYRKFWRYKKNGI